MVFDSVCASRCLPLAPEGLAAWPACQPAAVGSNQLATAGHENAVTLQTLPPKHSWRLTVSLKNGAYSGQPPPPSPPRVTPEQMPRSSHGLFRLVRGLPFVLFWSELLSQAFIHTSVEVFNNKIHYLRV